MTEIVLNTAKFSIPTTITAALVFPFLEEQNQLPTQYYSLSQTNMTGQIWEEIYIPSIIHDEDKNKIEAIHQFASILVNESENIPENFAKVLNEDFWDII